MIPYPDRLKVLVWSLSRDGKWFRACEGLDGDVKLRVGVEITPTMSEIWSLQEGRVWERLLVAFKAVAALVSICPHCLYPCK